MDPNSNGFSDFIHGFKGDDETLLSNPNQYSNIENGFKFTLPSPDLNFLDISFNPRDPDRGIITSSSTLNPDVESRGASMSLSPDGSSFALSTSWSPERGAYSPTDDSDSSDEVLKYISQMLMEEKMEDQPCMFYDPLALQATERSLYEVQGEQHRLHPSSLNQTRLSAHLNSQSGENGNSFSNSSSDFKSNSLDVSSSSIDSGNFVDTLLIGDAGNYNPSLLQTPLPDNYHFQTSSQQSGSLLSVNPTESVTATGHDLMSSVNEFLAQNMFSDSSDEVLKYISQMLMEEKMEDQPCMFYDPLALQATERSLYEVQGEQHRLHPSSLNQTRLSAHLNSQSGENGNSFSNSSSDFKSNSLDVSSSSIDSGNFVDTLLIGDAGNYNPSLLQTPLPDNYHFQTSSQQSSLLLSVNPTESVTATGHDLMSSVNEFLAQNMFRDRESVLQFKKGMEEASKFLPTGNQLVIDLESYGFSTERKEDTSKVVVKVEKAERENSPEGSRGRKNHQREDVDIEEGRSNKQSALYVEESELSDMFDKVLLLHTDQNGEPVMCCNNDDVKDLHKQNGQSNGSSGRSGAKKQGKKKETVDLRTLLILCAQAVSSSDCRTANELLKQIRHYSSPSGDGSQRLAHYFAIALEARLAGSGTGVKSFFMYPSPKKSAADMLKAYKVYLSACPFKKLAIVFANKTITSVSERATTLHIIDFGIHYGFQWPILIQLLSMRAGGPPKLRITGIEVPQPGFRPAERIEETGRRLAKYCERFNVPFEYNGIASQNWETIQIKDLKINPNEVLAVNSLFRFQNLLEETVEVNCPRNAVLSLIRKINPDIFVNAIVNGSYNAPFFVSRFREAVFHYSSLFDMFDTTIAREDPERLMFERELYGRQAMNVVACEGLERVERPETYKQWQVRITRAGFKQLPLNPELMKKFQIKLKCWYHKDFVIDEDSNWMLLGWKGRIVYASSCWVPS